MPRNTRVSGKPRKKAIRGRGAYYAGGRVLRGKGGFFDDLGGILKGVVGPVINAVDKVVPGAGSIASGIGKLVGLGAYSPVKTNAILAQPVPKVGSAQDRGIRYRHEEFLGDVTGSADWELTQFSVNPGLPESFPWLSTLATSFQKYKISGLVFYLKSTSSVAIASTENLGLGTVLGGFQYNVYDRPPSSKIDFLSLSGSRSGKPSDDHIFPLECDPSKNVFENLLIRHTGVEDDLAKYDHAKFNLATVGFPGEYFLGELWVSYDITLMAPKVEQAMPFVRMTHAAMSAEIMEEEKNYYFNFAPTSLESVPPVSVNTLGISVENLPDGYRALKMPPGISGTFLLNYAVSSSSANMANTNPTLQPVNGTCELQVPTTIGPLSAFQFNTAGTTAAGWMVFTYSGKSDTPGYFRVLWGLGNNSGYCQINACVITRLSDTFLDSPATTGVVSSRYKVSRGPTSALARTLAGPRAVAQTLAISAPIPRTVSTADLEALSKST